MFRSCEVCIDCVWSFHAGICPCGLGQETLEYERPFWYIGRMVASNGKTYPPSQPVVARKGQPATYQTRISDFGMMERTAGHERLSLYAYLYSRIERKLFADVAAGRSAPSLKQEYLRRYRIPARMFNALRVSLEGKVASVREQQLLGRDKLQGRISRAQGQVAKAGARAGAGVRPDWLHQNRRRLGNLEVKLAKLEEDIDSGRIRLCFGSRRLCGSSTTWQPTATPATRNGSGTGAVPAATSSSYWGAKMRRQAASCAWPRWLMMGLSPCGSGCLTPLLEIMGSTWTLPA